MPWGIACFCRVSMSILLKDELSQVDGVGEIKILQNRNSWAIQWMKLFDYHHYYSCGIFALRCSPGVCKLNQPLVCKSHSFKSIRGVCPFALFPVIVTLSLLPWILWVWDLWLGEPEVHSVLLIPHTDWGMMSWVCAPAGYCWPEASQLWV